MAANRCVFFSRVGPLPNLFVFFPNERREKGKQKPLFARRGGKYTRKKKLELKLCSVWRTQLGEKRERETSPFTFSIDITTTRWKRWTRSERRVAARKGQKPIPPPPRRKMKLTRKRNRCLFGFFFDSKPFRRWIERSRTIYNNELMTFVFQTETTSRKSTGETGHSFQKVQFNDQRDFFCAFLLFLHRTLK